MNQADQQEQDTQLTESQSERMKIIDRVRTPLNFFVLIVLVVEAILGIVVGTIEGVDRTITIIGMLLIIGGLVGVVTFLAIKYPEALFGKRAKNVLKPEPGPDYHLTGHWRLYYYLGKHRISEHAVGDAKITKSKQNDFSMMIKMKMSKSGNPSHKVFKYNGRIINSHILTSFQSANKRGGLLMAGTMVMLPNSEGDQIFCGATYVRNDRVIKDEAILKRK